MTKSLTALLLATACISSAYADTEASTTKLVFTKKELLAAVQNPHYTTVKVMRIIKDVSNVELRDGLTLEGATESSGLEATANDSPLLTVGKNNTIKNLTLIQHSYWEPRVIRNNAGSSVGELVVEKVKTNGAIDIALGDASTDSKITLQHNVIHLAPYATTEEDLTAGIILTVQNNSQMTVQDVSFNDISSLSPINLGIYNRAYENGTIEYTGGLSHNMVTTHGQYSIGFYNYADGGHIKVEGPIHDNKINVDAINTQAVYNHANEKGSIELLGGYQHNHFTASSSIQGTGMELKAEQNSYLTVAPIQNNKLTANNPGSFPFTVSATEASTVKLAGTEITQNSFNAGFPLMAAIYNRAAGANSVIDYGLGNAVEVAATLNTNNILVVNEDVTYKVGNIEDDGGVIR